MTDKVQKIRAFLVGIADADGVSTILAKAIEKKILPYIDSLQEEPVSEDLEKAANEWDAKASFTPFYMALDDKGNPYEVRQDYTTHAESFKAGAEWQKANLWRPTDGDDLPEIDREVVALLDNGKVVFAHRPPEYWDGKDIVTGKVTRNYPKTYDKGGWNIPNVKWWLDCSLPKEIEL